MNLANNTEILTFLAISLATWRISNLLMFESGPFGILEYTRKVIGVKEAYNPKIGWTSFISDLMACMYCFSVWVGVVLAISLGQPLLLGFAYSAVAILIEQHLTKRETN